MDDGTLVDRAKILREKGTGRARFFRGQMDKYTWIDTGSSWIIADILAAILVDQLRRFVAIQATQRAHWDRYASDLANWATARGVRPPCISAADGHTAHMFQQRMPDLATHTRFIDPLRDAGTMGDLHCQRLHLSDGAVDSADAWDSSG